MSAPTALVGKRFAFHTGSYNPRKASVRLRVLAPIAALRRRGVEIARYDPAVGPRGYDAIIFSKSYTRRAAALVEAARAAGCIVVSDVCDSVIERAERRGRHRKLARIVRQFAVADLVTVATAELGATLATDAAISAAVIGSKLRIVPDMLEDIDALAALRLSLLDRFNLRRLGRFHARNPAALHCIWFGKSFGDVSGFAHLDTAVAALEAAPDPITLTICSDDRAAYNKASKAWRIPHIFVPWTLASFPHVLAQQRVAVIPVVQNSYTMGKTINRPAAALRAGLGVVADTLPSYRELAPFVYLDDWPGGLRAYARSWKRECEKIAAGNRWLDDLYGADRVAACWERVLVEAVS